MRDRRSTDERSKRSGIKMKKTGPRTEPCGTPQVRGDEGELCGRIPTVDVRDERYAIDSNDGHLYHLKKIHEIQKILTAERNKRNELSAKYNRGVNIIRVIDNCLGVTAIGLGITGVGLLSTIVAAPVVIGIEAVSIVMGLLSVVGNQAIKELSLKIETHQKNPRFGNG